MPNYLKYIIPSLCVLFFQVIVLDNLHFLGLCHPFAYVWLLLLIPIEWKQWTQMLMGMVIGLAMDIFDGSIGVHTSACIMVAYLRPLIVAGYVQDIQRMKGPVTIDAIGLPYYLRLIAILVSVHHTILFFMEAFTFTHFGYTLLQIILSGIVSFGLIIMLEYMRKQM